MLAKKHTDNNTPVFKKLVLEQKDEIEAFCNNFEPYSDFIFSSLFCWDTDDSTEISMFNGNLIIKFTDYLADQDVVSVLGNNRIDETMLTLLQLNKRLSLVPEVVINNIQNSELFNITEDVSARDYVYDLAMLSSMTGNGHKKKRNKLNRVIKDYGDDLYMKEISVLDDNTVNSLMGVAEVSKNKPTFSEREYAAIKRTLKYAVDLNLLIFGVYYREHLVGFSINEKLANEYGVCHFEKVLTTQENINIYLVNRISKEMLTLGCKKINWEQDLGIDGLRNYKTSYKPQKFLKKYYVSSISGTS